MGWKIPRTPGIVSLKLHFIGKVGLVFCKLPLGIFSDISGNNMPPKAFSLVLIK